MTRDLRYGAEIAHKKMYVTPEVRRIGLSLAEVTLGTGCWMSTGVNPEGACPNVTGNPTCDLT